MLHLMLPSQRIVLRLLDVYFAVVHPSLPMLNKPAIMRWSSMFSNDDPFGLRSPQNVRSAGVPSFASAASAMSPELIFSLLAAATPFIDETETELVDRPASVARFTAQAMCALNVAVRRPTLATVQALLLLVLADWGAGELTRATVNLG